jgi:hypothetical protein
MQWAIAPRISAFVPATEFLHRDVAPIAIYAGISPVEFDSGQYSGRKLI